MYVRDGSYVKFGDDVLSVQTTGEKFCSGVEQFCSALFNEHDQKPAGLSSLSSWVWKTTHPILYALASQSTEYGRFEAGSTTTGELNIDSIVLEALALGLRPN